MEINMESFIQLYERLLNQYTGYGGILCQKDRDQGDSAQREGLTIALLSMMGEQEESNARLMLAIGQLEVRDGVYRRCSNPHHWGSNPNNLSRDQRAMLELAMALQEDKWWLKRAALYIIKRCGFHQNTHPGTDAPKDMWKIPDIVSPGELAVYIRGLDLKLLYPFLYLLDLGLLIDIKTRKKWDGANMSAINIMYANIKMPTTISKLASKLYKWEEAIQQITKYYTTDNDNNGIPPLGAMYINVIKKYLAR